MGKLLDETSLLGIKDYVDEENVKDEKVSNKVTTLSSGSTDTQYPSAKLVYVQLQNVREVAEGKCKAFILSYQDTVASVKADNIPVYDSLGNDITSAVLNGDYDIYDEEGLFNPSFNSQTSKISALMQPNLLIVREMTNGFQFGSHSHYIFFMWENGDGEISEFNVGDLFYVIETEVPDRWVGSESDFYVLETTKVNIANMVTTNTAQDITGEKTIKDTSLDFAKTSATHSYKVQTNSSSELEVIAHDIANNTDSTALKVDSNGNTHITYGKKLYLDSNNPNLFGTLAFTDAIEVNNTIRPSVNNLRDLGSSSSNWKDAYLSGNVYAQNTSNVINASDITSNTLTQDQLSLVSNGKPTLIKGQLGTNYDIMLSNMVSYGGTYNFLLTTTNQYGGHIITGCRIDSTTGAITTNVNNGFYMNYNGANCELRSITQINGKTIPSYPSNTGTFVLKCVDGTLTWVQES